MDKKKIPVNIDIRTIKWIDTQIQKGVFASYSHAGRVAFKELQKNMKIEKILLNDIKNIEKEI